jgi:hypothetical protein
MAKVQIPGTNDTITVDDSWGPEEVDRAVKSFQAQQAKQPQVPGGGYEEPLPAGTVYPEGHAPADADPSETAGWGEWADKQIRSAVHGTGRGLAQLGDLGLNVGDSLINTFKSLTHPANAPVQFRETGDAPLTTSFDQDLAAPLPEGKGYQKTSDVAEIFGPAALEALLTSGASLPLTAEQTAASTTARGAAAQAAKRFVPTVAANTGRAAVKTIKETVPGVVGGTVGGEVAGLAGEKYRGLGELLGSAVAPASTSSLLDKTLATGLLTPQSAGKLATIDRINEGVPAEKQIKPTVGTIGKGISSAVEDVTSRSFLAPRAAETRLRNYENLEGGVQEQIAAGRGGPATGPITAETIGHEAQTAIQRADDAALTRLQLIQNELEAKVGKEAPTGLSSLTDELDAIISNPKQHSKNLIDEAVSLKAELYRNMQRPSTKRRIPGAKGTAGYGAIKEARSGLGNLLSRTGQGYSKGLRKKAYGGLTKDMEEAAAMQGVSPEEFAKTQKETSDLMARREELGALKDKTEGETYRATAGKGGDIQHMESLLPEDRIKLIADDLEKDIRGGSAGRDVNPQTFNVRDMKYWTTLSPERKRALARNNPEIERKMDDLASYATMEETRAGQRSRPGKGGSTLGTSLGVGLTGSGPALGLSAYALTQNPALAGILAASTVAPRLIGNALTSPKFTRKLVEAREKGWLSHLGAGAKRPSLGGAAASANVGESNADRARREEENRRERKARGFKD